MTKQSILTEALKELESAHTIIRHALNLMTPKQKAAWAAQNESAGVDGEGATRANEREALIRRLSEVLAGEPCTADHGENTGENELRNAISLIGALADDGFSDITSLASAALLLFERQQTPHSLQTIAGLLSIIQGKAEFIDDCIGSEVEQLGCGHVDEIRRRRSAAICSSWPSEVRT